MEEHIAWMVGMSALVISSSLAYGAVYFSIKLHSIAKSLRELRKKK